MNRSQGFSLIEVIVTIAIVGLLLAIGLPSWQNHLHNSRIRATAQSFLTGLQAARTEAVRRNANVDFVLTDATTLNETSAASALGRGWVIRTADGATFIEGKALNEGGRGAGTPVVVNDTNNDATANADAVSSITFTGLGRTTLAANSVLTFTNPAGGPCHTVLAPAAMRCLNIVITRGGQAKMCDPTVTAADTRSCL